MEWLVRNEQAASSRSTRTRESPAGTHCCAQAPHAGVRCASVRLDTLVPHGGLASAVGLVNRY